MRYIFITTNKARRKAELCALLAQGRVVFKERLGLIICVPDG